MTPHTTKILTIPLFEPLRLKRGGVLEHLSVAYEIYGQLSPARDNAVLLCHALTGDAHCSDDGREDVAPGWWNFLVGPARPLDTRRFCAICINVLGGCKGTTGPLSPKPGGTGPYLADFPEITVEDMVLVQKLALEALGIRELHAVIGGSLGGMQVLEWSVQQPAMVRRAIALASGGALSTQGLAFDIVGRRCIMNDPAWEGGRYQPDSGAVNTGLAHARMIGHITYITKQLMERKFGRDLQDGLSDEGFNTAFTVESYLQHQGEKFIKRFDANSYLYITKAMDSYSIVSGFRDLGESLSRASARFLLISFSSDWLYPPENSVELACALAREGKEVTYACIDTELGHDAFLVNAPETQPMQNLVRSFLEA